MRFTPINRRSRIWLSRRRLAATACMTALSSAIWGAAIVHAEERDATKGEGTTEVVVTALRRSSALQKTPMSISAISGEALRRANIQDLSQLKSAPGLTFVDLGPAYTRLVIRGIQTVGEPTVGLYYDETPVTGVVNASNDAGGSMPGLKLFDVDHVEVLRGPQGTLYGSGAMGGAVRVLFNKPGKAFASTMDVSASRTEHGGTGRLFQGMINLPVVDGKFAVRAVGFDQTTAGYIDNTVLGFDDIGEVRSKGGRLLARLTPVDTLTIDAGIIYQENRGDRPYWNQEGTPYNATNQVRLTSDDLLTIYNGSVKWDLRSVTAIGSLSFSSRKNFTANGDPSYYFETLIDNPAVCARLRGGGAPCSPTQQTTFNSYVEGYVYGVVFAAQKAHTTTAEFRLSSRDEGRLMWTGGAFYSDRDGRNDNNQFKVDPVTGLPFLPWIRQTNRIIDDELRQGAVYGEATYALTPKLKLTLGTRFFHYERTVGGNTVVPLDLINAKLNDYTVVKSSESKWVSKVNLAYQASARILLYAEAAEGFRPGGVNQVLGLPAALQPYRSDSLWNYETGLKTRLFDNRVTLNVDAYHIDWSDMQVQGQTTSGPFNFISNAGAAEVNGLEAEASARMGAFLVSANASYSDAKLSQDQANANITANGKRGDRIPYVPKVSGGVDAEYGWAVSSHWRGYARASANYVGESFSEFRRTNLFNRRLPSYTLVNARIGIEDDARGWGVYGYVNNLFDEIAITSSSASAITTGQTLVTSAAPRTIGINVRKAF